MFWFIFRCIISKNKYFKRANRFADVGIHTVECQPDDGEIENGEEGEEEISRRSPVYLLFSIWAYFELSLLTIVLFTKEDDGFPNEIWHDYCTHKHKCIGFVEMALAYKVASCIFLIIGSMKVGFIDGKDAIEKKPFCDWLMFCRK